MNADPAIGQAIGFLDFLNSMQCKHQFAVVDDHLSPWDAHICRALLESEGIPSLLTNEHHITANWQMALVLGGVRVLVHEQDWEAARQTLALRDSGVLEAALMEEQSVDPQTCTRCRSRQFRKEKSWMSVGLAVSVLLSFGVIFPPWKQKRCMSCGLSY